LDNISLNADSFTVYFGDVLNTETKTGNQYYLLGTYVEIPYNLSPSRVRLHREIINEYETGGKDFDGIIQALCIMKEVFMEIFVGENVK